MIRDIPANTNPGHNLERLDSKQVTIQDTTELPRKEDQNRHVHIAWYRRVVSSEYFTYNYLFLFNILFRQNQRPSRTLHSEISLQFYSIRSSVNFNSVKSSQDVSLLQANEVWGQVMFLHVCHSVGGGAL